MPKKRVPSVRPPARPLPLDARPKNQPLAARPADIARRAYLLYLARGCEHGHDVEDWLQAERALRAAVSSARPWVM